MTDTTQNNKRIAKNTIALYLRTLLTLVIGLYTSRVVLNTLGVTDYGIYNVVGGVITMLNFLTSAMGAASSRFITYDLGKGDKAVMKRTFGNIKTIHLLLAIIILVFGESIGLWFVMNKMQIPAERMNAALWVYQISIFTSMLSVISVPYNAAIIAHEHMKAFAYIGVVDALLKLGIVYLLYMIPFDKLIIYAILFFCVLAIDRIIYNLYCTRHFEETRTKFAFDKKTFKEIFSFASWTMNGCLASVGATQGVNILLNLFFGPAVNAARGIAVEVQNGVKSFCYKFQIALNPQLTKCYAQNNLHDMHKLLRISSKFSFYLLLFLSLPIFFETPLILKWWLITVPEHTINFVRLILCLTLLNALSNPLVVSVHSTGHIKRFQIIEGSILLCILPFEYVILKLFDVFPEIVFLIHIFIELCAQYARIRIVLPMIEMDIDSYIKDVIFPILKVLIISPILPFIFYLSMEQSVNSFFIICSISAISVVFSSYLVGCNKHEKVILNNKISKYINKIYNHCKAK
jgi:O-antigen/teichoic acid export membrane protein